MSKKDYQALATALYNTKQRVIAEYPSDRSGEHTSDYLHGVTCSVRAVADVLANDNPRLDRVRFMEACETGRTKGMKQAA